MKKLFAIVLSIACSLAASAQVQTPSPSAAGSVSTTVGLTEIKVTYFRPSIKGRVIFGTDPKALVPFGKIWRTGANYGTKISFADDVKVEGIAVPKGEYLVFTWPNATEWTVALNKDVNAGTNYDESKNAALFKVKPSKLTEKVETFTINIGDIAEDNKSAKVQLAWENTSVKFTVAVDYDARVMKSIEEYTKVNPGNYFQAAVYYLETGRDMNQALTWINEAAKSNPDAFWVLYQKARIQQKLGDKAGAAATAQASLDKAKAAGNRDYQMMNENLLKTLK